MLLSQANKTRVAQSNINKLNDDVSKLYEKLNSIPSQTGTSPSDYNNLENAVLNDPSNANSLGQIFTELKNGKLLIPPGNKCNTNNMLNPFNAPAFGSTPTPTEITQGQSTADCLKIVDDTFIGQYIANNTQN